MIRGLRRGVAATLIAVVGMAASVVAGERVLAPIVGVASAQTTGGSGLPLPRFVSLKSSKINVRVGPGQSYDVAFVFVRPGLPVEVVQEFDNWRKIRDSEGAEGWIFQSLLSGGRTAIVAPWETDGRYALRTKPDADAPVTAYLEPNVLADVEECDGAWCRLRGDGFEGWLAQESLWGIYPKEVVD